VYTFDGLKNNIDKAVDNVKPENYKNYFQYAYGIQDGSSNIYKIADNAINNIERPSYLCRDTSNQGTLPSVYNQTLCGYEKTQP